MIIKNNSNEGDKNMEIIENIISVDPKLDESRTPIGPALRKDENGNYMAIPFRGKNGEGKKMKIDLKDYADLNFHGKKVYLSKRGYPITKYKGKIVNIHRLLLGLTNPKDFVDHKFGAGTETDNRRLNLRKATNQENQWNSKIRKDNTTGYKGVRQKDNKYEANIGIESKNKYLGRFKTPHEAAIAFNYAASLLRGDFTWINENIDMNEISEERKIEIEKQTYEKVKEYIKS